MDQSHEKRKKNGFDLIGEDASARMKTTAPHLKVGALNFAQNF